MSAQADQILSLDLPAEFGPDQQVLLERFFEHHAESVGLNFGQTAGFLFAVMSCPEMITPSQWLEPVLGEVSFRDQAEASQVLGALYALQNWVGQRLDERKLPVPEGYRPADDPFANFEAGATFAHWVKGFSSGHGWLREIWDRHVPDDDDDDGAGLALMTLTFFGSRRMAEGYHQDMFDDMDFDELVETAHRLLPEAFFAYAAVGRGAYMDSLQRPVRTAKIGRNEPCPCGSGKKHKKCCGRPH
jgi:uncharacterized protein